MSSSVTGGALIVASDAGDAISITCTRDSPDGQVKVNGADPDSGVAACGSITGVSVTGASGADAVDLSGVSRSAFSRLPDGGVDIRGGGGDDLVTGSDLGDSVDGGSGGDVIDGLGGNDALAGGPDADDIAGFDGNDKLEGGGGIDVLGGEEGADELDGGDDRDSLFGGEGDDRLRGGDGADLELGGGAGSDRICGGRGDDQLNGGGGGGDYLWGGSAADCGGAPLEGDDGDDTLSGDRAYPFKGTEGDDALDGGTGTDTVAEYGDVDFSLSDSGVSGLGSDTLTNVEKATLFGGGSRNTLDASLFSGTASLIGSAGDDTLIGGPGDNVLGSSPSRGSYNESGDDTLVGNGGNDEFIGSDGFDRVVEEGGEADDSLAVTRDAARGLLLVGRGTDKLSDAPTDSSPSPPPRVEQIELKGAGGDDTLDARDFPGKTILSGDVGGDVLTGGSGADLLRGGPGDDALTGNAGTDRVVEEGDVDFGVTGTPSAGRLTGLGEDTLAGVEQVELTGGSSANSLDASAFTGAVTLVGGAGEDRLAGGSGDDRLSGGAGDDALAGNDGADLVVEEGDVDFVLTSGRLLGRGTDRLSGVERAELVGGPGANSLDASGFTTGTVALDGAAGDDTLTGGPGGDVLAGEAGRDALDGGRGDDALTGGDDGDVLVGAAGDDTLVGEAGVDSFSGDAGDDILRTRDGTPESSISCGSEHDTVTADAEDVVGSDCEVIRQPSPPAPAAPAAAAPRDIHAPRVRVSRGRLTARGTFTVRLRCPSSEAGGCAGSYRLVTARRLRRAAVAAAEAPSAAASASRHGRAQVRRVSLARGRFRAAGGRTVVIRTRLSKRNLRLVRRLRRVPVRMVVRAKDGAGNTRTTTKSFVLKLPQRAGR